MFSVADTVSKSDGGTFDGNVTMAGTLDVTGDLTVDTSTLYVDSTNNRVGIGATSLSNKLTVNGDQVLLANGELKFADATNNQVGTIRNSGSSATSQLEFLTASTERMRIDASGNLLVGTTSQIQGGKLSVLGDIGFGTSTSKNLIGDFGTSDLYMINYNSGTMRFHVGGGAAGDEAMRIDSSRNLLVGTTDSSVWDRNANSTADNGGNIRNDGRAGFSYYNASGTNATLNINRTGTDGILAEFRKSGTAVGSIGVNTKLYIGGSGETHTTGVSFQGSGTSTNRNISPSDGGGTLVDGAVNLGSSSARWNSLWLSGGVYLGGTGSANKLDDYEEGTWTPTITTDGTDFTTSGRGTDGYYTKIGNKVVAYFSASINSPSSGTGNLIITGLPFTANNISYVTSMIGWGRVDLASSYVPYGDVVDNTTTLRFLYSVNNANPSRVLASDLNGNITPYITGSITYRTNS